jgi:hypothetical protein
MQAHAARGYINCYSLLTVHLVRFRAEFGYQTRKTEMNICWKLVFLITEIIWYTVFLRLIRVNNCTDIAT